MKINAKLYWSNARAVVGIAIYTPVKWTLIVAAAPFYVVGLILATASWLFLATSEIISDAHHHVHGIINLFLFPSQFIHAYKSGHEEGSKDIKKFYKFRNKSEEWGFKLGRKSGERRKQ